MLVDEELGSNVIISQKSNHDAGMTAGAAAREVALTTSHTDVAFDHWLGREASSKALRVGTGMLALHRVRSFNRDEGESSCGSGSEERDEGLHCDV